jgi:hypothetical protein
MGWRAPQEDARAESAERSEAVVRRRFCRAPQGSHWDPTAICMHMDMHMDMACLRVSARARASCACEYARVCVWVIGLRHLRAMRRNLCFCLWLCGERGPLKTGAVPECYTAATRDVQRAHNSPRSSVVRWGTEAVGGHPVPQASPALSAHWDGDRGGIAVVRVVICNCIAVAVRGYVSPLVGGFSRTVRFGFRFRAGFVVGPSSQTHSHRRVACLWRVGETEMQMGEQ